MGGTAVESIEFIYLVTKRHDTVTGCGERRKPHLTRTMRFLRHPILHGNNTRLTNRCLTALLMGLLSIPLLGWAKSPYLKDSAPQSAPPAAELRKSTHPGYKTPAGVRQECIGRLLFDVPGEIEWGVQQSTGDDSHAVGFSDFNIGNYTFNSISTRSNHHRSGQKIQISSVDIDVRGPVPQTEIQQMINNDRKRKQDQILKMEKDLEEVREQLKQIQERRAKNDIRDFEIYGYLQELIEILTKEIFIHETKISAIAEGSRPFDLGLTNSAGYQLGSVLFGGTAWIGYIWRDQYLYTVTIAAEGEREDPKERQKAIFIEQRKALYHQITLDKLTNEQLTPEQRKDRAERLAHEQKKTRLKQLAHEQQKARFDRVIKHFRPRQRYEIPPERGICFPYGFIQDEGTEDFEVENVMRFTDQPGVVYSLLTKPSDETLADKLEKITPKSLNIDIAKENTASSIGPRRVTIGALAAQQNGIMIRLAKHQQETYALHTRYPGYQGSQVLPTIVVDMVSINRDGSPVSGGEPTPTLKKDPPPLSDSLKRLNSLLKSIRLRPTEPPMPELALPP